MRREAVMMNLAARRTMMRNKRGFLGGEDLGEDGHSRHEAMRRSFSVL